jgi:hypothetical protein
VEFGEISASQAQKVLPWAMAQVASKTSEAAVKNNESSGAFKSEADVAVSSSMAAIRLKVKYGVTPY